jgi:hypothetical protein
MMRCTRGRSLNGCTGAAAKGLAQGVLALLLVSLCSGDPISAYRPERHQRPAARRLRAELPQGQDSAAAAAAAAAATATSAPPAAVAPPASAAAAAPGAPSAEGHARLGDNITLWPPQAWQAGEARLVCFAAPRPYCSSLTGAPVACSCDPAT